MCEQQEMIMVHPLLQSAAQEQLSASPRSIEPEPQEGNTEYKYKLVDVSEDRLTHLVTQMKWRLAEGGGECIYHIGVHDDGTVLGLSESDLEETLNNVAEMATRAGATIGVVRSRTSYDGQSMVAEIHLRRVPEEQHFIDVRIMLVGHEGSGKSTLIGVLTTGALDVNGSARLNMFRHNHEILTGRTAALNTEVLAFDAAGHVVNYSAEGHMLDINDVCMSASKLVHLHDSPGHAKFQKTTFAGLSGPELDYVMLVVSGTTGLGTQGREQFGVAVGLKLPVVVVVTKIDTCPKHVLKQNLQELMVAVKSPPSKRVPVIVKSIDDVIAIAKDDYTQITPIFLVSAATGKNIKLLESFLNLIPSGEVQGRQAQMHQPAKFRVEEVYDVTSVGPVVGGQMIQGIVRVGDSLQLGPDADGCFHTTKVATMQRHRVNVSSAKAGQLVTFAISSAEASRGMFMLAAEIQPAATNVFSADVSLLSDVTPGQYPDELQVTVFAQSVRMSAALTLMQHESTPSALLFRGHFVLTRPAYLERGVRVVVKGQGFRGIGVVRDVWFEPSRNQVA